MSDMQRVVDKPFARYSPPKRQHLRLTAFPPGDGPYDRWELTAELDGELLARGDFPMDRSAVDVACRAYHNRFANPTAVVEPAAIVVHRNGTIKLSTGKEFKPEAGVVGLDAGNNAFQGFDMEIAENGQTYDPAATLTTPEFIELADLMVARWLAFKAMKVAQL